MNRYMSKLACLPLLIATAQCMTALTLTNFQDRFEPVVYSGVRTTLGTQANPHAPMAGLLQTLSYMDLPFSAVLDTIILPVTIPLAAVAQSKDSAYEKSGNPYARLILPSEMELFLHNSDYDPKDGQRPFVAGQENAGPNKPDWKPFRLPVKNLETGVPGCYMHCATTEKDKGLFSLGTVERVHWRSVGLMRVKGVYKRERDYRNESFQYCLPDGGTRGDKNVQSIAVGQMCEQAFPECKGRCSAINNFMTLYYVNPSTGKVLPEK